MSLERSWCDAPTGRRLPASPERTTMMKHFTGARIATVAVASAGTLIMAGGVAYAFWTTSGTGSGTAKAASFQAITVAAGTAGAGQLYPGLVPDGSTVGGDLKVVTTNPNPFPVTATLTVTGATGCTTPGITLKSGTTVSLAANSSSVAQTLSKVVGMGTGANDDCQNATITVNLATASVSS
ncbi:MAG: hypothetical protein JWP14_1740 [Frankiales bacterium]|jgi:hypothetical protein|nr:hypothetical protein [Frankiales bacterium]